MKIGAYILGFITHWIVYIIAYNLFGSTGFMFYLGSFLSSVIGGFLAAIVVGKLQLKSNGTMMNPVIILLGILTIINGFLGIIRLGFGEIWEYLVCLFGFFLANGFFYMYVEKREQ